MQPLQRQRRELFGWKWRKGAVGAAQAEASGAMVKVKAYELRNKTSKASLTFYFDGYMMIYVYHRIICIFYTLFNSIYMYNMCVRL